jgi:ribosomal protein S18 acetylase RimI-like enzyme
MKDIQKVIDELKNDINDSYLFHYSQEEWGGAIMIMANRGDGYIRVYWFNEEDQKNKLYLEWLSVSERARNRKLGTSLMLLCEVVAKKLERNNLILWVYKNTWQKAWYERLGYIEYQEKQDDTNSIWMNKIRYSND